MRKEKTLLLNEVQQQIEASVAMLITRYEGMEPNATWEFRDRLAKTGSWFEVVRKRMFLKALKEANIEIDETVLQGHIGVVFINQEDPMGPTKAVYKFSEENGNILQVLLGQIEGKILPGAEIEVLSKLPSMDEMRATFIALLTSPMSQMLAVLDAAMAGPLSEAEQKS